MTPSLHYYLAVVEAQSISRAAERLYLSQQNLSNHIKRLEGRYGVLFQRRPVFRLTPAGRVLYDTARRMQVLEQGLEEQLRELREGEGGRLRLGIHAARARMVLPRVLERYRPRFPRVRLELSDRDTEVHEEMLARGEMDLFFGVDAQRREDFTYFHLQDEPIYFAASRLQLERAGVREEGGVLPLEALPAFSYLLNPPSSHFRQKIDAFLARRDLRLEQGMGTGDFELQLLLAARHAGACFCPQMLLRRLEELNRGAAPQARLLAFRVEGLDVTSELSVAVHRLAPPSRKLEALVEAFREEFREEGKI